MSYADYCQNKSTSLWQSAQKLRHMAASVSALSPFVFMSDPARTENIVDIARKLPKGAALMYRHFGADNKYKTARDLRSIDGLQLLIGNDPELAARVNADGVHMARATAQNEITYIRQSHPNWVITQAAPKDGSLPVNLALDALIVSAIFPSKSPSAGHPIGTDALGKIIQTTHIPIIALGGITARSASLLMGSGAAGLASINGILKEMIMSEIKVEQTSYGHRFVYSRDGHDDAELTMVKLKRGGETIVFDGSHTGVPKSMGGQGVGKALIKFMSDHARENGYKVVPSCPFIAAMFKRNPDWAQGITA